MSDRLKNRFRGTPTPNIENDISTVNKQLNQYFFAPNQNNKQQNIGDIIKATKEQNFVSPFIQTPEKIQIPDTKFVEDAPRKREADSFTQSLFRGLSTPLLSSYQELGQAGDEFKQGKVGSGIADLLKGTLHTVMTPITAPIGGASEVLKSTGYVGGEVAKGLEQVMNLPFDAVKQGSELVKQAIESTGLDISDSETSKKFNDLAIEVGGLLAMGKGIREAKKYVETKVPELKVLPKDPELVIKSQETTPSEGLTQEKLPIDILKERNATQEGKIQESNIEQYSRTDKGGQTQETSSSNSILESGKEKVDRRTALFNLNKVYIKEILDKEGLLTPQQVSRRLTALKEQGKLRDKVSVESIKSVVDEWSANRPKRPLQEIKGTENDLGIAIPKEMNDTRAVSFDRRSGLTVKEVLEQNPEFKPYVKDLKDINEVTMQLNSLYWKKRYKEPLPELPQEKTPETSFDFGENVKTETPLTQETTSVKNEMMNTEREFRGLEPIETEGIRKQEPLIEDAQKKIESGEIDPNKLAKEIVDNPRILNDSDVAVLQVNARRLKNETTKLVDEISKETDPTKIQELRQKSLELEEQYNINDIASKQTGTDTARALAIRRLELKDDYSVAPLIQRAKIANKGETVPEEIRIKLETYSKQIAEADAKVKEYEVALAKAQAEKILQDAIRQDKFQERTQKRQAVKKDLDVEYEELIKEFAKTQQFNALIDPHQVNLLIKCARNRFKKGVVNVEQLVDQLYQDVKQFMPELTKKDIYDAIGGMGRFQKMSENDIKVELKDIRRQRSDESLQKAYKTRLENRKAELERMLETGNYEKTPRRKTKMNPELSKLKDEVDLLKLKADREVRQLELQNRTTEEKIKDTIVDVANIPRTLMSSIDLSAPLRQGVIQAFSHPKIVFGKDGAFREMFKYFKNEKNFRELQREIEDSPNAILYNKSGLYLANEKSNIGRLSGREEAYLSNLPERIPILGRGIRGSERAYTGFLDKLRMDMFDFHVDNFQKSGITFESNPKAFRDLAKMINASTGRGTLGGFERSATALSTLLFSPRLIASRLQMINPRWYFGRKLDPAVRKILWKDMSKFVGVGTSILALAKLAGAEVETDPRSTDFGKIKTGNTRLDIWGGFQQYAVFLSRMATNQTKQMDGDIKSLSGKEFPFRNRWDLLSRFGEQKMSPVAGLIRDAIKGKTFEGKDFEITDEMLNIMIPLYLQDMAQAIQEDGIEGAFKTMPAIFGVGTQTYKPKKQTLKF